MAGMVLASVLAALPNPLAVEQTRCDLIEINHVHDEFGLIKFVQLIAWDWCPSTKRHHVRAWKLMDDAYQDGGPAHRAAWEQEVERIADSLGSWQLQDAFLRSARYRGIFVGGRSYPRLRGGEYVSTLTTKDGVCRELIARSKVETRTQYDRELEDRKRWPESRRVGW